MGSLSTYRVRERLFLAVHMDWTDLRVQRRALHLGDRLTTVDWLTACLAITQYLRFSYQLCKYSRIGDIG